MRKILLDTDIGTDIDDCFALTYLLSRDDIEIVGITTVSGQPDVRAQLADNICQTFGVDTPIHVGAEMPLSGYLRQPDLTDEQMRVAQSNPRKFSKDNTAIEFMRDIIEANPHEITLISIGQLTNSALLFEAYPHTAPLLKDMLIMGGKYGDHACWNPQRWGETEWNILCDIAAADAVFKSDIKQVLVIGIEQTCRFHIPPQPIKQAFYDIPHLRASSDSINTIATSVYFHDPLVVYAWLNPEEVTLRRGTITMNTADETHPAATYFTPDENGKHVIVSDFCPEKFFRDYTKTVGIDLPYID